MKKKQLETFLYSTIGVVAMLLIVVAFNFIASRARQRIDLTDEKAYTLSPGTRAILAKLDTPVQIRFYCTKNANAMPVFLTTYAQRVEDLLSEYQTGVEGQNRDPAARIPNPIRTRKIRQSWTESKASSSAPENEYISD